MHKYEEIFLSCFLQGVERVQAYIPDAVWYNYETVRQFPTQFKIVSSKAHPLPLQVSQEKLSIIMFIHSHAYSRDFTFQLELFSESFLFVEIFSFRDKKGNFT